MSHQINQFNQFEIIANGDTAFTIIFEYKISESLSRYIINLAKFLEKNDAIEEVIPAYQSLTIIFNHKKNDAKKVKDVIKTSLFNAENISSEDNKTESKIIEIPVCYSKKFGFDQEYLAKTNNLSIQQIIQLHTQPDYLVHMRGFSPGFLYLGGLDPALYCERKTTPQTQLPPGSIGIGGQQTGIYPQATPSGWQIIGRTPLNIFNPEKDSPFIAEPLNKIKFIAIDEATFYSIKETQSWA